MVLTPSTMLPLGTKAPDFELVDTISGCKITRDDFNEKSALLVMFICNHCPYVKHLRQGLAALGRDYAERDIAIVAISANDPVSHPDDAPHRMTEEAREAGYRFPYLFDETQQVARAYTAACTPDFFLFDKNRELAYRGQFDSSRPGNGIPVTGEDLRRAIDAVLSGQPAPEEQRPSIGCNIKWRAANIPNYSKH